MKKFREERKNRDKIIRKNNAVNLAILFRKKV